MFCYAVEWGNVCVRSITERIDQQMGSAADLNQVTWERARAHILPTGIHEMPSFQANVGH